jgi:transcriptional regulator with XRE-family HTH domain
MDISLNLKKLRNKYGFLQKEVAEAIGIYASNYNKIEKGERQLTVDMLVKLAAFYNCPIDEILYYEQFNSNIETSLEDKDLLEKLQLIKDLDPKDQETINRVIDTVIAKEKYKSILDKNKNL